MIFRKIASLFCRYVRSVLLIPIAIIRFIYDFFYFNKANKKNNQYFLMPIKGIIPMLLDRYKDAGTIDRHYFLQDIYVASKIIEKQPKEHYDVGSRVDGFISILLAALKGKITIIDIRPLPIQIDKLNFICADATSLSNLEDGSLESLSSLHAIEHFGLGRYGDQIMPHACYTAMRSLQRVVKGGGIYILAYPLESMMRYILILIEYLDRQQYCEYLIRWIC